MPHYYFDTFDGQHVIRDDEGQNCESLAEVEHEADDSVRELVAAAVVQHVGIGSREMRVRNAADIVVCVVRFRDVLEG